MPSWSLFSSPIVDRIHDSTPRYKDQATTTNFEPLRAAAKSLNDRSPSRCMRLDTIPLARKSSSSRGWYPTAPFYASRGERALAPLLVGAPVAAPPACSCEPAPSPRPPPPAPPSPPATPPFSPPSCPTNGAFTFTGAADSFLTATSRTGVVGGGTGRPVALLARSAILLCNGAQAAAAGGVAARVRAERARGGGAADVARRGGALL